MMSKLILLVLLLIFATSCNGQGKPARKAIVKQTRQRLIKTQGTGENGCISSGLQDRRGNLWFATSGEGVYCYNGTSFINYTTTDGLCSNSVSAVLEDKAGNIWLATSAGLCRCNQGAEGSKPVFASVPIIIANEGGAQNFTAQSAAVVQPVVNCMLQDKKGVLWIGTRNDGIYCYDPATEYKTGAPAFTHFLHNDDVINNSGLMLSGNISSIIQDTQGNIWITTWFEGICRYDGKSITSYRPNNEVWFGSVFEDKDGTIWVGRRHKGLLCYRQAAQQGGDVVFTNVRQGGILDSCGICGMAQDREGNIWFGAEFGDISTRENFGGVWRYDGKSFKNFTTKDGLSHNSVFTVTADKSGGIWVGTRNTGLCRYNTAAAPGTEAFTNFSDNRSHDILRVFQDREGNLWLGTNGDGVCRYTASSKVQTYFSTKNGLAGAAVRCMAQDKAGNIWFGTNAGVSVYDGKEFTSYTVADGLPDNDTWSILAGTDGTLWAGTLDGAAMLKKGAKRFARVGIPPAEERDFSRHVTSPGVIWDIKEDKDGMIWLATNGRGVYSYDHRGAGTGLTNFTEKDGLASNFVNCILIDAAGDLWFGTQHGGVSRYSPSGKARATQKSITTYAEKDGLCDNEVWVLCKSKSGDIWLSECGNLCRYNGAAFINVAGNTEKHTTMVRNYVQSIIEDANGILWVGCSGGLYSYDGTKLVNKTREWATGDL